MTSGPPHEPTRHVLPAPQDQGRGDAEPPDPPHELSEPASVELEFELGDEVWIARLSGKGACGTGSYGLGLVEAVHFCRANSPDVPVREALIARGRFAHLYPAELSSLWSRATAIATPEST
jgi:hypothetical protein